MTGGCGFIGSHVVDRLVSAGHDVVVVDLRRPHRADVEHQAVDISDLEGLVTATRGADAVFHLAAVADVNDAYAAPVEATDLNVLGTAKVWEACRRNGVRRAILASTVWVYGKATGDEPLDESSAFNLSGGHLYTSSKLAAEMVVQSYHELYGQPFTILRYGIPYGPRMRPSLVITRFIAKAIADEPITLQGDGSQYRYYVYVEDLAEAHLLALGDAGENETFNLEGRERVTIRRLVDAIGTALQRPLNVVYEPARAGDYAGKVVSPDKAERVLGWTAQVPFETGLARCIEWYQEEQAGQVAQPAAVEAPRPVPVPVNQRSEAPAPERVAALLAGAGLASLVVPALTIHGDVSPSVRSLAVLATVLAFVTAWLAQRRTERAMPAFAAGALALVTVWLLGQVSPGVLVVPLALLLGLTVGTCLPPPVPLVSRSTVNGFLLSSTAILGSALLSRPVLFWVAAGGITLLVIGSMLVSVPSPRFARMPNAFAASTAVVVALMTSWVGATSAQAKWFGPLVDHGSRQGGEVAITFDGVPGRASATRLLGALDASGVHATFFAAGQSVATRRAETQELARRGHLLANHAWTGRAGSWLDPRYRQLDRSEQVFADTLGGDCPTFFRPPGGLHTPLMAQAVRHRGLVMVTWDVLEKNNNRTSDPQQVARRVLAQVRPGSIIALELTGDDRSAGDVTLARALPIVLQGLEARGLRAVRLDELLHADGYAGHCKASPSGPTTRPS